MFVKTVVISSLFKWESVLLLTLRIEVLQLDKFYLANFFPMRRQGNGADTSILLECQFTCSISVRTI